MSIFTAILLVLSAVGYGSMLLHIIGLLDSFDKTARPIWGFTFGVGVLGWLGFWFALAGWLAPLNLLLLVLLGLPGLWLLPSTWSKNQYTNCDFYGWILLISIFLAVLFDVLEGLSPPIDADSLAYHFALPKLFLEKQALVFQPRALDGAIPLLQQMTYMLALGIGDERTLTLWTMFSGWGAAALIYVTCRRYLPVNWALAVTVLFLTTPAVVYAAGSGQVEVRNSLFTLASAVLAGEALARKNPRFVIASGIAIGFFAASKYSGLIVTFAIGLALISARGWFGRGIIFATAFFLAASQWYVWNWYNTGDPIFPVLFDIVPYFDNVPWTAEHNTYFKERYQSAELGVSKSLFWFFAYPLKATLNPLPVFDSLRTGLGVIVLAILPLAAIGFWRHKNHILSHPLKVFVITVGISYALWFILGPSQRIRHLLPLYPLLLIGVFICAYRITREFEVFKHPVALSIFFVMALQLGGQGIFTIKNMRYFLSNDDRNSYINRHVGGYKTIQWINSSLTPNDLVFTTRRELIYLFEVPVFYGHKDQENQVNFREGMRNPDDLASEFQAIGITHVLQEESTKKTQTLDDLDFSIRELRKTKCLKLIHQSKLRVLRSRTLPSINLSEPNFNLYKMDEHLC